MGNSSFLYAVNTTFQGGRGAFSNGVLCPSGTGGPGLFVSCDAEANLLNCTFLGGFGGRGSSPGPSGPALDTPIFCGSIPPLVNQGTAPVRRSKITPSVVTSGNQAQLSAEGVPGDVVFSIFSTARMAEYMPSFLGSLVLDAPYLIVSEGIVAPIGTLEKSFLPAPLQAPPMTLFQQAVFFGADGQVVLSDPSAILVVR